MQKASSADKDYVLVEHGFEYTAKDGTRVSIKPHERYILLKKNNEHWWQVCRDYKSHPFYIPAKYVKVLSPFSQNSSGMFCSSSEETMEVPSTEYSYKFLPARSGIDAIGQRFSIAVGAGTHSLCDLSVTREDPAEHKPLLDKSHTGPMSGSLRTFHNSKKILDPLKRISYMCPPEIQPSIRSSQSLNDLQVIMSDPPAPNPRPPEVQGQMEQLSIQEIHVAGAEGDFSPEKNSSGMFCSSSEETMEVPSTEYSYKFLPARSGIDAIGQRFSIAVGAGTHSLCDLSVTREDPAEHKPLLDKSHTGPMSGSLRTFHNSKKILDPLKRISYMCPPEIQPSIRSSQSLNDLRVIMSDPPAPNPRPPEVQGQMEQLSIQEIHVAGAEGDFSPEKNSSGMFCSSSEETMEVPSTEYSYKFLPARSGIDAIGQRFSIAVGAGTHSLCDLSVTREDPAEHKPLLDKSHTGPMSGSLRTFHNSKKILDPLKRISYMCPPEIQPSIRSSQSLNDLRVIMSDPPAPNPRPPEVQGQMEQLSIQEIHVAGAEGDFSPEKVVDEKEESFYVNLEEFRKDGNKPRSSQHLSSSSTIDDWETHIDQGSGQLFYYNCVTGETTWDCPFDQSEELPISPASRSPTSEDSNWEKLFDESSRQFYFYNPVTGETSWDPPAQDQLHPSGGKPMFSPDDSMDRRPPTPETDYPEYSSQELVNYPAADYDSLSMPSPPYKAPSEEYLSGWSCHVKDGPKLYTNNYNGDTLGPSELQRGYSDPNQNSTFPTSWRNNYANFSSQKETEVRGLEKAGLLQKAKIVENGKRLRKNWSTSWTVLEGGILTFFKDNKNLSSNSLKQQALITIPEYTVELQGASLGWASKEKSSKKNVIELKTKNGSEYLIHHDSETITKDWLNSINKCIGRNVRMPSENTSENETDLPREYGSTEKLGPKDEKKGQNNDSDRNVRSKLRKFLQRRPTLQSLRDKGYIRDQVFGCHLHHLCEREKGDVPQFVSRAIQAVEKRGLDIDGLYRVSGNLAVIQKLRYKVDHDENFNLEDGKWEDVHVITGALKLFFRELPEPLFPFSHFADFVEAIKLSDQSQKLHRLSDLVRSLPTPNLETMRVLFRHLCSVIDQRESNRMSVQSVAIVFGPTLLRPAEEGGNIAMYMVFQNQIVEQILNQYKYIFS